MSIVQRGPNIFGASAVVLLLLVIALWFILATTAALRADTAEPPNRIAQMYAYTMCLIAVVVGLTTMGSLLDAGFQRLYPLKDEYRMGASLGSFEAFKATYTRERGMFGPNVTTVDTASDATLRTRYQALVEERIGNANYRIVKTLVTSGIMFVVAAAIFLLHWRWLHRNQLTYRPGQTP